MSITQYDQNSPIKSFNVFTKIFFKFLNFNRSEKRFDTKDHQHHHSWIIIIFSYEHKLYVITFKLRDGSRFFVEGGWCCMVYSCTKTAVQGQWIGTLELQLPLIWNAIQILTCWCTHVGPPGLAWWQHAWVPWVK